MLCGYGLIQAVAYPELSQALHTRPERCLLNPWLRMKNLGVGVHSELTMVRPLVRTHFP